MSTSTPAGRAIPAGDPADPGPLPADPGRRPPLAPAGPDRRPFPSSATLLGAGSIALGLGIALVSLLGPLAAGLIRYRVADTALNQQIGADAFGLIGVLPLAVVAGLLALRGHPAGPVLALGPAAYGMYMQAEEILAPDYLRFSGNNERYVPLFLALFVLSGAVAIAAWRATAAHPPAPVPPRMARGLGVGFVAFAAFMVLGRYFPALADAMSAQPTSAAYRAAPTLFWTITFEDLGVVLPLAIAVGAFLMHRPPRVPTAGYLLTGWLALVPPAVAAMAIAMAARHDPTSGTAAAVLLSVVALACTVPAILLYRPLLARR